MGWEWLCSVARLVVSGVRVGIRLSMVCLTAYICVNVIWSDEKFCWLLELLGNMY